MNGDVSNPSRGDIPALAVWLACAAIYALIMTALFIDADFVKGELGLMESLQNIFLLIALVMMIALAFRADTKWLRAWMAFVAFGTFYLLGEEISWGQHYFGWEIGGIFEHINDQGETNFHNSEGGWLDQKPRALLLLGMILGTIVHPIVKWARKGRGLFDNPWWLAPTLASLPPVIFSQLGALPERLDELNLFDISMQALTYNYRSSELEEVFMYVFFITYTLSLGRRLMLRGTAA